jgi:hypothetical protein
MQLEQITSPANVENNAAMTTQEEPQILKIS